MEDGCIIFHIITINVASLKNSKRDKCICKKIRMAFVLWMTGQPNWKLNQIFSKYLKNDNQ